VAITPSNAALLLKKGFQRILVEHGAGAEAQFTDHAYEKVGVTLVPRETVWAESDILLKVRAPSIDGPSSEVAALREGTTTISFLYPAQNRHVVEALAAQGVTAFAMDLIPRISRAQVFDALRFVVIYLTSHSMKETDHYTGIAPWQILQVIRLSWRPPTTSDASLLGK
jgi:NAD(P) transhydrogenase